MFCPNCRSEFREGITRCPDCDVDLVAALPEERHDQAPWVPVAHSLVTMPMSKKVKGYKVHPLGTHIFEGVDIEE